MKQVKMNNRQLKKLNFGKLVAKTLEELASEGLFFLATEIVLENYD